MQKIIHAMPESDTLDTRKLPRHIAIIMDGNGRWAQARHLPRIMGHRAGVETVKKIVTAAREIGIRVLTLYAFSTENWNRPPKEVEILMSLLKSYLKSELETMTRNNVRLMSIGRTDMLPVDVREVLNDVTRKTEKNSGMILNLALSYGGRDEITVAIQKIASLCVAGNLAVNEITGKVVSDNLFTAGLPDPDLVIRTSGESRLSNFLLWQASYAELYFTETKWPDFNKDRLIAAIAEYQRRQRRFGMTGAQIENPEINDD